MSEGFQGSVLKDIERRGKEEEEGRENEADALPNHDCNQLLHRSSFGVLRSSSG